MAIYVVSSIGITQAMQTAFHNGVIAAGGAAAADPATIVYEPALGKPGHGYAGASLYNAIHGIAPAARGAVAPNVLATFGGLVTFQMAYSSSQVNFVSLIGGTPSTSNVPFPLPGAHGTNPLFCGFVSLESYAGDAARIQYLSRFNYASKDITLLCNPNSYMQNVETWNWPSPYFQNGGVDIDGNNHGGYYLAAFGNITTPSIVVSADPFFFDSMPNLVRAANQSGKFVCYPLQEYGSAMPAPIAKSGILYGPSLLDSITDLGKMAGLLYNTPGTVQTSIREPMGIPTIL